MDDYIKRKDALVAIQNLYPGIPFTKVARQRWHDNNRSYMQCERAIESIPAADVVEVRQIQAFIDKLIAERDKYDLHSMRWEHYDCDRLLIEQMLDEIDGERKGGAEARLKEREGS